MKARRDTAHREVCGLQEVEERTDRRERLALRNMVKDEHVEAHGGLGEDIGMKTYLHRPMDYARRAISCRGRGPARKKGYTRGRKEEDAQVCPCGKAIE